MRKHCSDGSTVYASFRTLSKYTGLYREKIFNLIHGRDDRRNGNHIPGLLERGILSELAPTSRKKTRPAMYHINESAEEKPHPSTVSELIKSHGTARRRLTPTICRTMRLKAAESVLVNRRIAELCDQRTPGPDLMAIINQEMGLNWSLRSYCARVRRNGCVWIMKRRDRTCQFQGKGCRRAFEPKANDKYCDVCKKAAKRENRHAHRAKHLQRINETRRKYNEGLRKLANIGRAANKSEDAGKVVLYLLRHRDASNAVAREATKTNLSDRYMTELRALCRVPAPTGRPKVKAQATAPSGSFRRQ